LGTAFDLFFTNEFPTACAPTTCSVLNAQCATAYTGAGGAAEAAGKLTAVTNVARGYTANMCLKCASGEQEITQTFSVTQPDQCAGDLTAKGAEYKQTSAAAWYDGTAADAKAYTTVVDTSSDLYF